MHLYRRTCFSAYHYVEPLSTMAPILICFKAKVGSIHGFPLKALHGSAMSVTLEE